MKTASEDKAGSAKKSGGGRGDAPLYRVISDALLAEIESGVYKPGDRLPSEALLCERFSASRITVAKAIGTLQREHLVRRRAGSGTYVEQPPVQSGTAMRFGLLIPDLGVTEIFEPICRGMMSSPLARPHSLIWGHSRVDGDRPEAVAADLCQQFVDQRLTGVFFAPLEFAGERYAANLSVVQKLERAKIAIVLLDRCFEPFPRRSGFDLIGIDNHRAGATMTKHLLQMGAKRPVFVSRLGSGSTVYERAAGYQTILRASGLPYAGAICHGDIDDPRFVQELLERERPDALQCANDHTAAKVMRTLIGMGIRVPQQMRVTGVDDVRYAQFLPVPLTTLHQNCAEMGRLAMATMLERVSNPAGLPREVLTDFELVARESCGAKLAR